MTRPTLLGVFILPLLCAPAQAQVAAQASANAIPKNRTEHSAGKERGVKKSDKGPASSTCPRDTAMTGRRHLGDENGDTMSYEAAISVAAATFQNQTYFHNPRSSAEGRVR